jgi:hypothetical protein
MGQAFDPALLLEQPLMAHLATASPEGPRGTPVWYLWEEEALWIPGDTGSHFVARVVADPRVAVDIVDYDNAEGRLLHLGLRGRAEVKEAGVAARFRRLLARYLGDDAAAWNAWFLDTVARPDDPETRMIRLRPESVFTSNVSYFRTGPQLAAP